MFIRLACITLMLSSCLGEKPDTKPPAQTDPVTPDTCTIDNEYGKFKNCVKFVNDDCPKTGKAFCKLESLHQFRNKDFGWESEQWSGQDAIQSGTTNGADIPKLVWPLVGHPFDPGIIQAAIIHDHYTFEENRVREWYPTHKVYLDILLNHGVDPIKAYTMYFAIYVFGDHWQETVDGEHCVYEEACIKTDQDGQFVQPNRINTRRANKATQKFYHELKNRVSLAGTFELSADQFHEMAIKYDPENLFLQARGKPIALTQKNKDWFQKNTIWAETQVN